MAVRSTKRPGTGKGAITKGLKISSSDRGPGRSNVGNDLLYCVAAVILLGTAQ